MFGTTKTRKKEHESLIAFCSTRAAHQKTLEYISTSSMAEGLPLPPPAVLPAKFKGRPHAYVEYLNGGLLPYHDCGESACTINIQ